MWNQRWMGADGKESLHHPLATATFLPSAGAELTQTFPPCAAPQCPAQATAQTTLRPSYDPETGKTADWEKRSPAALLISSALGEGAVALPGELGKAPVELSDSYTRDTGLKAHR